MSFFAPKTPLYLKGPFHYLPEQKIDNEALIRWMGREIRASWIEHRTGIQSRHWVQETEACSDLAAAAAERLFAEYSEERAKVKTVLLATISGDYLTPPTSPLLQERLGLTAGAFDLTAACAGFVTGLHVGAQLALASGEAQLLISSEVRSKYLSKNDLASTALFGDGAAACMLDSVSGDFQFVASHLFSDGKIADIISIPAGGSKKRFSDDPEEQFLTMKKGAVLFLKAAEGMADCATAFLAKLQLPMSEIDWVVPHQANLHLVREVAKKLKVPTEKVVETVPFTGNTSGASVGIALAILRAGGRVVAGQKILLVSAGGGGLAACALLEAR
jgi:3-oxoacyl-[acyl-carrier-protein] synthase-3